MEAFFDKLAAFRTACIADDKADPYLRRSSSLYLKLMGAERPLSQREISNVHVYEESIPAGAPSTALDQERIFHHLWVLNAWARYHWFVLADGRVSSELTLKVARLADRLFLSDFAEDNAEKRCLPLILALNIVRLSAYSGECVRASERLSELNDFVNNWGGDALPSFPDDIHELFDRRCTTIKSHLSPSIRSYLNRKTRAIEARLQAEGASP